jgi:hypothetical protein
MSKLRSSSAAEKQLEKVLLWPELKEEDQTSKPKRRNRQEKRRGLLKRRKRGNCNGQEHFWPQLRPRNWKRMQQLLPNSYRRRTQR